MLLFECGRAGLCGGKLFGPSILRDIIEFRLLLVELSSPAPFTSDGAQLIDADIPTIDNVNGFTPGVLDVDRCIFGDDGTLPIT